MARGILSRLAGAAVSLHRATLTVERIHFDRYLDLKARSVPILFALWHGRMFLSIQAHRHEGIVTMAWNERLKSSVSPSTVTEVDRVEKLIRSGALQVPRGKF